MKRLLFAVILTGGYLLFLNNLSDAINNRLLREQNQEIIGQYQYPQGDTFFCKTASFRLKITNRFPRNYGDGVEQAFNDRCKLMEVKEMASQ